MIRIPWKLLLLGTVLAVPIVVGVAQDSASREVNWRSDYNQAREEARDKGLPLVIDFGTKDCTYCIRLDQTTFRDSKVIAVMNERFVPLKVDANVDVNLASQLRISAYPTIVLAAADGKILETIVGYKDAADFHENLQRVLAKLTNPEWMERDLQMASKCIQIGKFGQAIPALRTIIDEAKGRPIQSSAEKLLNDLEQKADERLRKGKELLDKGQSAEALDSLTETVRVFPGLQATKDASELMAKIAQSPEVRAQQRAKRAGELLAQARDFYKNRDYIPCLDRCEWLVGSFGDMPEGREGSQIAAEIKNNREWMQNAAEVMSDRLGGMWLALADSLLKSGQPQQTEIYLQKVIQAFPGSRQAESAEIRLRQLQGLPLRAAAPH